jgi:hypothetical protein
VNQFRLLDGLKLIISLTLPVKTMQLKAILMVTVAQLKQNAKIVTMVLARQLKIQKYTQ